MNESQERRSELQSSIHDWASVGGAELLESSVQKVHVVVEIYGWKTNQTYKENLRRYKSSRDRDTNWY